MKEEIEKCIIKRLLNRFFHTLARFSPGATSFRPFLHRLRGVKIGKGVFIGEDVYIESEYPEYVEIKEGAQIALRSIIMAHFRGPGKVVIGKNVWIGPNCVIASNPGTTLKLGEGCVLAASSVVTKNIKPFTFVGGVPAKPIAKVKVPMTLKTSFEDWKNGLTQLDKQK